MIWLLLLLAGPLLGQQDKAALSGKVYNSATGEPVRKARVTLQLRSSVRQELYPVTTTDEQGRFEFKDLEPGEYSLSARRDGFADGREGALPADPIALGPGARKTEFQVKLVPHGVVSGVITDSDGDPIRNMQVSAMVYKYTTRGRELTQERMASTNDLGEFRFFDIPPGKYFIQAGAALQSGGPDEREAFAATFFPGTRDLAGARQIVLEPGQHLSGFNFLMRRVPHAAIRGRVIVPDGAANVQVGRMIVRGNGSSSSGQSVRDKEGKFAFFGVAAGPILLVATYTLAGKGYIAQLPVQVGSEDIDGIELRPMPRLDVTGRVRIDSGARPPLVTITLQGAAGNHFGQSIPGKDDGSFRIQNVPEGRYSVDLHAAPFYLKSVHWGQTDITEGELEIVAGSGAELAVVLASDGGHVEGVVRNGKQEPVPNATVTFIPAGRPRRTFYRATGADRQGKFRAVGLAPGAYTVFAWEKVDVNAVVHDPDFLRPHEGAATSLQIGANERKTLDLQAIRAEN